MRARKVPKGESLYRAGRKGSERVECPLCRREIHGPAKVEEMGNSVEQERGGMVVEPIAGREYPGTGTGRRQDRCPGPGVSRERLFRFLTRSLSSRLRDEKKFSSKTRGNVERIGSSLAISATRSDA